MLQPYTKVRYAKAKKKNGQVSLPDRVMGASFLNCRKFVANLVSLSAPKPQKP